MSQRWQANVCSVSYPTSRDALIVSGIGNIARVLEVENPISCLIRMIEGPIVPIGKNPPEGGGLRAACSGCPTFLVGSLCPRRVATSLGVPLANTTMSA